MLFKMETKTSKNTLFIRNLPYKITNDDLETHFSDIGPLKSCFVVKNKDSELNRGFGYVQFSLVEDAEKALKKTHVLSGRKVSVTYANKKLSKKKTKQIEQEKDKLTDEDVTDEDAEKKNEDRQKDNKQKSKKEPRQNNKKVSTDRREQPKHILKQSRLIVRNLSFKCTESDLVEAFSKYGEVTESVIPKKPDGKKLGFGFVQLPTVRQAEAAIHGLNLQNIKGRPVAVDWALSKYRYMQKTKASKEAHDQQEESSDSENEAERDDSDQDSGDESGDGEDESESEGRESAMEDSDSENEESESEKEDSESENEASEMQKGESDSENEDFADSGMDTMELQEKDNSDDDANHEDEEKHDKAPKKPQKARKSDVEEGRTVFIRNLPFDVLDDELEEVFEMFGDVEFGKVVMDKKTEHSKGTGFVKFGDKASADQCIASAEDQSKEGGILIGDRRLLVTRAVERDTAEKLRKKEKEKPAVENKDGRNLWLAREGMIRPGTQAAEGLTKEDLAKRTKVEQVKRAKLKNPSIFVSTTRICVRNIPATVTDARLRDIYRKAVDDKAARITECRIMRDLKNVNASGVGKSRGFAFVNFEQHKHALEALRKTNNNPEIFGDKKRLIVEFSLENRTALQTKERRLERAKAKQEMKVQGKDTFLAAKRRGKKEKQATVSKVEPDEETLEMMRKNKGMKGMPSHWGPKVRHKKRPQPPAPKKEKPMKRKADEDVKEPKQKKMKKNKKGRPQSDDFDKLVNKYTQKLSGAMKVEGVKKGKWFNT